MLEFEIIEMKHWHFRDDVQTGLGILEEYGVPYDLQLRPDMLVHIPTLAIKFPKLIEPPPQQ